MLIKPRTPKIKIVSKPNTLGKTESNNPILIHPAYFGTVSEIKDYIEEQGRLLLLPVMYEEFNIRQNKLIHDRYLPFNCEVSWSVCTCNFARMIRMKDLYLDNENLLEVI